ncbi:MAG: hypothetical protein K6E13_08295 [Lachnospiraceae bacterium]|nr:hypothetical protein [Lachnospiraceae bacterium]
MRKEEMHALDYFLEAATFVGMVAYVILQIFYNAAFEVSSYTMIYRVLMMLLLYGALLLAEYNPETINVGSGEKLVGKVRFLAVRMIRYAKLIITYTLLIPAVADIAEYSIDEAYCLIAVLLLLLDWGYHMYKIYKYNKEESNKK